MNVMMNGCLYGFIHGGLLSEGQSCGYFLSLDIIIPGTSGIQTLISHALMSRGL